MDRISINLYLLLRCGKLSPYFAYILTDILNLRCSKLLIERHLFLRAFDLLLNPSDNRFNGFIIESLEFIAPYLIACLCV
jgi:hypothetical protein